MAVWLRGAQGLAILLAAIGVMGLMAAAEPGRAASFAESAAPQTVTDVLEQMSGRAAVIFVGKVLEVRSASAGSAVVEVDFYVDTAIRGCTTGRYTVREWAGLWGSNAQRYHAGQHLLMLLHAPGAAGLTSPVDGLDGAIPIRQGGSATAYANVNGSVQIVDLRWLGAKLPRSTSYRQIGAIRPGSELPPVPFVATAETMVRLRSGASSSANLIAPASGDATGGSVPAEEASVDAVVSLLTGWERVRNAAP